MLSLPGEEVDEGRAKKPNTTLNVVRRNNVNGNEQI